MTASCLLSSRKSPPSMLFSALCGQYHVFVDCWPPRTLHDKYQALSSTAGNAACIVYEYDPPERKSGYFHCIRLHAQQRRPCKQWARCCLNHSQFFALKIADARMHANLGQNDRCIPATHFLILHPGFQCVRQNLKEHLCMHLHQYSRSI